MGRPWSISVLDASSVLAAQADGWDPATVGSGSNTPYPWHCTTCGLRWSREPVLRKRNPKCPGCENRVLVVGFNDVATRLPHLLPEVHGWDPSAVRFNEMQRVDWKCPKPTCAQVYDLPVCKRNDGQGCPFCAGKRIAVGVNDLATTHPSVAAEADGWDPTEYTAGSARDMPWKCAEPRCGWQWTVSICNRALQGTRCPACSNKVVVPGYNDLATTHPELAAQAMGQWNPSEHTFGSDFMGRWQCPDPNCLRQWNDTISHRTSGRGCPDCALLKRNGDNRLATTDPHLAEEAWGWDPRFVTSRARLRLPWRCKECLYVWRASVAQRGFGSGCPRCSRHGFRPDLPGYVYLLSKTLDRRVALKIGISNNLDQRLNTHARYGWSVVSTSEVLAGVEAKQHETEVLTMLDATGVSRGISAFGVAFPGYTESWWEDECPVTTLNDLLARAHQTCSDEASVLLGTRGRVKAVASGILVRRMKPGDVPSVDACR